ncbi:MAG: GatB/YqeY domain-containing protein [Candidatus Pacebacteria bacterium]|nr:GatB/YqeY domain-containing protein [Candidatus Paceibacterota bacterium]
MQEKIKAEIKPAMLAKDTVRLGTLRMILAAFTNELVTQGHPPTDPLSDEDCMKVIKRLAKQRKDSIDQFVAGGRPELADDERAELTVIEGFLPAQMSEAEIESRVAAKLAESPLDPTKKGQFIGMMCKELGDTADGATVKAIIDKLTA